jgi:class 3 adenylate cyclase
LASTPANPLRKTATFSAPPSSTSRICAHAGAGETLIPEPLRHLLAGKSYVYADRGEIMLKGFVDAVL